MSIGYLLDINRDNWKIGYIQKRKVFKSKKLSLVNKCFIN